MDAVRPRAIVFDLDDTLYRERRFAISGYAAVARHVERTFAVPACEVFRVLVQALRRERRATAFQAACARFRLDAASSATWLDVYRSHPPRLRLPRSSRDLLARLRGGWRLGVLTNGLPRVQRAKVEALGLERLVDAVVYAEEHGARTGKPDPAAFLEVASRLGVTPACSVLVGDDPVRDVAGARATGMRAVWLRSGRAGTPDGGADAVIGRLAELPAALARLGLREVEHAH
jgi:putative hydrolase of the HAD superfamily